MKAWLAALTKKQNNINRILGRVKDNLTLTDQRIIISSYLQSGCLYGLAPIYPNLTPNQRKQLLTRIRVPLKKILNLGKAANNSATQLLNPARSVVALAIQRFRDINEALIQDYPLEVTEKDVSKLLRQFKLGIEDPNSRGLKYFGREESNLRAIQEIEGTAQVRCPSAWEWGDTTRRKSLRNFMSLDPRGLIR